MAARPLQTALIDPTDLRAGDYALGLDRIRRAGASFVRVSLYWQHIAPQAPAPGSDPTDPANPAYRWDAYDAKLTAMQAAGLEALVAVVGPPRWAQSGRGNLPEPAKLAAFAQALARRYDGRTRGVPRVRYWQLWIEPNVSLYFKPQLEGGRPVSPVLYRELLQAFTPAVRSVNPSARVVAGGLSPFGRRTDSWVAVAPLRFMRDLLCVSVGRTPKRTCRTRVPFDVWGHHPYTSGGPRHRAFRADDVSLGDLPEMRRVLDAARRLGHVSARSGVGFWVTEFSWDTNPPDPKGVPAALHARWTAEALYRMWAAGVSLVAWLALRDEARPSYLQSGLWYRGTTPGDDRPKPALQAFRFPLVAFPQRRRIFVWGRTPAGQPGDVVVERSFRGGWARLGVLKANTHGIFSARFWSTAATGSVRARVVGGTHRARPFSLRDPGDLPVDPFGS